MKLPIRSLVANLANQNFSKQVWEIPSVSHVALLVKSKPVPPSVCVDAEIEEKQMTGKCERDNEKGSTCS